MGGGGITPRQSPPPIAALVIFTWATAFQNFSNPVGYYAQKVNLEPCTNMWQVYIHIATFFQVKMVNFHHLKSHRYHQKVTCMFKDARLTQNDEFYLVTDTEGNIGIICFWNLIEVTDPELLQKKNWYWR